MIDASTILEVTRNLIGDTEPYGDSAIDRERTQNLDKLIYIVDELLYDVEKVAVNKDRHEGSMRTMGEKAHKALNDYWSWINTIRDLPSAQPESCEYWDAESNYCALNRPSAQPERKKGKWTEKEVIHAEEAKEVITEWQSCKCSVCGRYHTEPYMYFFLEPSFCSWCGADMRGDGDAKR